MASEPEDGSDSELGPTERDRLGELRSAEDLSDLVKLTGAGSEHDAYFEAKREWADLRARELDARAPADGLPGNCVVIDGHEFWVHGVTHAGTRAEREFLREHVSRFVEGGATVYCEQGIRSMYFSDFPGVCEMDDYLWAMKRCEELDVESHLSGFSGSRVEDAVEDIDTLTSQFQDAVFSLIRSNSGRYGEAFAATLGSLASAFLTSHEDLATGDDFESFTKTRRASNNPENLADLQRYYAKTFLPQPLEREWLRRHDRELELVTHARNERMADYAVFHNEDAKEVHLIVGAAHQPGVTYYLEQYRDGEKHTEDFQLVA